MLGVWRNLRKNSDLALAGDLSQLVQAVLALAAALGVATGGLTMLPAPTKPIIGGMLGAAIIVIFVWVVRILRRQAESKHRDWNPGIWIKSRDVKVTVKSKTTIEYSNHIGAVIASDNVQSLNWRLGWTGEGCISPYVKNRAFSFELEPCPVDNAYILKIKFDYPRNKGDEIDIYFGCTTEGTIKDQQPFYSMTLYESRLPRAASIQIEFLETVKIEWARKEVFANDTAVWPMSPPEMVNLGRDRVVDWQVQCEAGRRYGIRWQYEVE